MKSLCIGDFHFKDPSDNPHYNNWDYHMFRESIKNIGRIYQKEQPDRVILVGDTFNAPPKHLSWSLFDDLIKMFPKDTKIIALDGNHEKMNGGRNYFKESMSDFFSNVWNIDIKSWELEQDVLFCSHRYINKLERLTKPVKLVFTHFRSGIQDIAPDEIDVTMLKKKADLVVAGDIHHKLSYSNVVYTNSPIDTHFTNDISENPSVLILDEDTLKWKWVDTLDNTYRKEKVTYDSVNAFLRDVDRLESLAFDLKRFFKVVIVDKKTRLRQFKTKDYESFCKFSLVRKDLEYDDENKAVVESINKLLNQDDISENLLEFTVKNNDHPELEPMIKSLYASYERK